MKKNLIAVTIYLLIGIIASTQSFGQGTKIKAEEGTVVRVKSLADISSKDAKSGDLVLASTVALSLVVSPLFLLKKGKEVNLPKGHLLEAYVAQDVEIVVQ